MTGKTDVKHMKWWGWGVEGVAFHHEDKPGFAPFVLKAVAIDLWNSKPAEPSPFGDIEMADPIISAALLASLTAVVGADNVSSNSLERVVHTFGKSLRDLVRVRSGRIDRAPDVVVYPADEAQVQGVVDAAVEAGAVIIPFGGGSNIAGSLEPLVGEKRTVVSLDLGRLNKVIDIDSESGLARIQAGVLGPYMEEQLEKLGWTLGHFPDSFTYSTLGGWVATRSSGMQSDKYGDIADIARGLRVVRPGGTLVIRAIPSASTGPSVRDMIVGSEGRLGVITEVTVQVHRIPEKRDVFAYFFPSWAVGLKAMQEISESDATPSITRVSDSRETNFSLSTSKESRGFSKFLSGTVLPAIFRSKGWNLDEICLSFIGYEGGISHAKRQKKLVDAIVKKHNGMGVGKGPGVLYDQKKFDTPYLRDFLLDRGAAGDVSESAAPWSKLAAVHDGAYAAAQGAFDALGRTGWIMSHLSHSYHSGACLYFTFAFAFGDDPLAEYDLVKNAIQQSFVDNGGSISHHHGVGLEHSPWLEQDISAGGVALMNGLFASADPSGLFNPGKIIFGGATYADVRAQLLPKVATKKPVETPAKKPVKKAPAGA